jgi:hypothetical protein
LALKREAMLEEVFKFSFFSKCVLKPLQGVVSGICNQVIPAETQEGITLFGMQVEW